MLSHESADLFDGFSCFWEVGSEGMPDMGHVGVHTKCDVNARRTGVLNGLCRVVEKNFCVANLEEERWKTFEVSIERRDERIFRIGVALQIDVRGLAHAVGAHREDRVAIGASAVGVARRKKIGSR